MTFKIGDKISHIHFPEFGTGIITSHLPSHPGQLEDEVEIKWENSGKSIERVSRLKDANS